MIQQGHKMPNLLLILQKDLVRNQHLLQGLVKKVQETPIPLKEIHQIVVDLVLTSEKLDKQIQVMVQEVQQKIFHKTQ